jgi:hypothetical protein
VETKSKLERKKERKNKCLMMAYTQTKTEVILISSPHSSFPFFLELFGCTQTQTIAGQKRERQFVSFIFRL